MNARSFDVIVYGATGYTGRLICQELDERGSSFAISGRSKDKLDALSASLKTRPTVIPAGVGDGGALFRMAQQARVVLSCAGPFMECGIPVQDAAMAAGAHFLDISGETPYMLKTAQRDALAKARGVALINAVGFDVVPSDCLAALAANDTGSGSDIRVALGGVGAISQGTARSALGLIDSPGMAIQGGHVVEELMGRVMWEVKMPEPLGARVGVSVPLADIATAVRSTAAKNYRIYMALPSLMASLLASSGSAGKLLKGGIGGALANRFVDGLPEGPTAEQRTRSKMAVVAESIAPGGGKRVVWWLQCGDAYDVTRVAAVECALRASAPSFTKTGALTPSQAFGARDLLMALRPLVEFGLLEET